MASRVLVVEDDHDTRELLREILEVEGYAVETASDGDVALRGMRRGLAPDLVLLDMVIPGIGGLEVMEAMRADPRLAKIPVVALSATVSRRPLAPGAAHFFRKPFRLSELLEVVHRLLDEAPAPAKSPASSP